jgi:predicted DNA binding CopG/RHH family protein
MAAAAKRTSAELDADLERSQPEEIEQAELVHGQRSASAPISVRLSTPLLERLDRLAAAENRKRGNLIQHILWQYVKKHRA